MEKIGLDWDAARWKIPLVGLMLLARQKGWEKDPNQITLDDKEVIDRWQNID